MKTKKVVIIILASILIISTGSVLFYYWTTKMAPPTNIYEGSTDIKMAVSSDYDNSIVLYKDKAVFMIDHIKVETSYDSVNQIISRKIDLLKQKEFNIICTKETDYKTIVHILDAISINKIARYKLLKA